MADLLDIKVLVPRVRRALGEAAEGLTDQEVTERVADAVAGILLFTEGEMSLRLEVAARDDDFGAPISWQTSRELTEEEAVVFALQAAIDSLTRDLSQTFTAEKFSNPIDSYEYQRSATALTEQIKGLRADRDRAVDVLLNAGRVSVSWVNTLGVRDRETDQLVEPFANRGVGGMVEL